MSDILQKPSASKTCHLTSAPRLSHAPYRLRSSDLQKCRRKGGHERTKSLSHTVALSGNCHSSLDTSPPARPGRPPPLGLSVIAAALAAAAPAKYTFIKNGKKMASINRTVNSVMHLHDL